LQRLEFCPAFKPGETGSNRATIARAPVGIEPAVGVAAGITQGPRSALPGLHTRSQLPMKTSMNAWILTLCLLAAAAAMAGCKNTAEGFGKDVENAGEKIQEKVD
jgi:predicted small secreted protein